MMDKYPKDNYKFNLRLSHDMRRAISKRAKKNGRSINSEIIQILDAALDDTPQNTFNIEDLLNINGSNAPDDFKILLQKLADKYLKLHKPN